MPILERSAFAAGVAGVGTGGLILIATRAGDIKGAFGSSWVQGVTNGQVINLGVGLVTTALGFIGIMGRGGPLGRRPGFSSWLLGTGMTLLVGGVVVPAVTAAVTGTSNSYAANPGPFPPPQRQNVLSGNAPMATVRNAQLIRALRG